MIYYTTGNLKFPVFLFPKMQLTIKRCEKSPLIGGKSPFLLFFLIAILQYQTDEYENTGSLLTYKDFSLGGYMLTHNGGFLTAVLYFARFAIEINPKTGNLIPTISILV